MDQVRLGKTSVALNLVGDPPSKRTYICMGQERGGTSAVAGVLRALGLPMGDRLEGNNEDPGFHGRNIHQMKETIESRNAAHQVWGWKYPTAARYLPALLKSIRNPHFVVVSRDVVATAIGRAKWDGPSLRRTSHVALHEASVATMTNTSLAMAAGVPCMFVSYEHAMADGRALVIEVADFLGIERPSDRDLEACRRYLAPGSYKRFEDYFPSRSTMRRTFGPKG